jgi:hypothetical protein
MIWACHKLGTVTTELVNSTGSSEGYTGSKQNCETTNNDSYLTLQYIETSDFSKCLHPNHSRWQGDKGPWFCVQGNPSMFFKYTEWTNAGLRNLSMTTLENLHKSNTYWVSTENIGPFACKSMSLCNWSSETRSLQVYIENEWCTCKRPGCFDITRNIRTLFSDWH